jgi:hypothetical protein
MLLNLGLVGLAGYAKAAGLTPSPCLIMLLVSFRAAPICEVPYGYRVSKATGLLLRGQ